MAVEPRRNRSFQPQRTYRILEKTLAIISESPWLSEHIDCFLRPLTAQTRALPDYRLGIFQAQPSADTMLYFCCPELDLACRKAVGAQAWAEFRQCYMRIGLSQNHPQYVLHAAAVADDTGRCAIVAGSSGAGKTLAMLGLLGQGWRYVTDDYACIPLGCGRLRALPTGCTVTEYAFDVYPELRCLRSDDCKFFHKGKWQWTIQPAELYPIMPSDSSLEASHFFFLYRDPHGQSAVEPVVGEDALWWFQLARFRSPVATTPEVDSSLGYHLDTCALAKTFARQVRFYRVMNSDIENTVSLIRKALAA